MAQHTPPADGAMLIGWIAPSWVVRSNDEGRNNIEETTITTYMGLQPPTTS